MVSAVSGSSFNPGITGPQKIHVLIPALVRFSNALNLASGGGRMVL